MDEELFQKTKVRKSQNLENQKQFERVDSSNVYTNTKVKLINLISYFAWIYVRISRQVTVNDNI